MRKEGSQRSEKQTAKVKYEEEDVDIREPDEMEEFQEEAGVRCEAADPRYIGKANDRDRRNMVLRGRDVKEVLQREMKTAQIEAQVWLTTRHMEHALRWENTELTQERDERMGKATARS